MRFGIVLIKIGDKVEEGESLLTIHSNSRCRRCC